jgi:hypothetical protein
MNSSGESAAREQWMQDAADEYSGGDKYMKQSLMRVLSRHYAAREREVQELVKAVEEDTRQIDRTHRLQLALAPFAAKGETE